ncbi:hypothetical protein SAMN04490355_1006139 [Pelosinus propionicus DSM 13327]|uniref:Uncharacterized protein n=1 Tax=Pelosinus propionicus DSM 13327 TaxID=1123291 RepID=A0A1I4I544_9FIRM|nr:hypothetical protein SAMN04490355_1006139 [Pelosinus propionicus DSM 13327]
MWLCIQLGWYSEITFRPNMGRKVFLVVNLLKEKGIRR